MKHKSKHRFFFTNYKGENKPEIHLSTGDRMCVVINKDYITQLYWVTDFKSLLAEVRRIINIYETKGTIY